MTDRIRTEFELFAHKHELNTASTGGRYNAPVVRYMWLTWQHQAERITDMGMALSRVHVRNATLANQNRQLSETITERCRSLRHDLHRHPNAIRNLR